ncbi:MAG: polyprenyl synthetase family protein [Prevotella sp.]
MSNILSITQPIAKEMQQFDALFAESLTYSDGLLASALEHIRKRQGKRMRPMLILLMAKSHGGVNSETIHAAVGLELLHTASLVHDDVVDESTERRGQASVNATYNNQVAVLVGDYLLSSALLSVARTRNNVIVEELSELGRTLAGGEILQLSNISRQDISEEIYYEVIKQKTAALFAACCTIGALSAGATVEEMEAARQFGVHLGIIFQIKDDIFDYFPSSDIGKPTGNDMAEGKLTLPVIHAVNSSNDADIRALAMKVKNHQVSSDEIARLVDYTISHGGIEYARQRMMEFRSMALQYIDERVGREDIRQALTAYLDYVIDRKK